MQDKDIQDLISRYQQGTCNEQEIAFLQSWYMQWNKDQPLSLSDLELGADLLAIKAKVLPERNIRLKLSLIWKAAAAVAVITLGVWIYTSRQSRLDVGNPGSEQFANDVAPGKNTATLTLASGKTIQLSDAKTGVIIGASKLSYNDGTFVSSPDGNIGTADESRLKSGDGEAHMLTASTPRGGTYQFTLPDGTKVWLNADSKIEFASNFLSNNTRNLKLVGEAYFEVAKDKARPFIVQTKQQDVEVLGTHFNVNAYGDGGGSITSLLEGSVKLSNKAGDSRVLKPGERGVNTIKGIMLLRGSAEDDVAWKNGEFVFSTESLEHIMNTLSRWYDVNVIYEDDALKSETFFGSISKHEHISKVLRMLEKTDVAIFKISGRTVTVMKKK